MNKYLLIVVIIAIIGVIGVAFITSNKPDNEQQLSTGKKPAIQDNWQQQTVDEIGLTL